MSITVVGSVGLDTVETPAGKSERQLGGAATYFSLSASFFTTVNLIGIVGTDFPDTFLQYFRNKRINIDGLTIAEGKTFFWHGRYHQNMNHRDTLETQLNVFADFQPVIPKHIAQTPFLFLGNIHPQLQLNVLQQSYPQYTGMDTMNLWIQTTPDALQEVLSRVHILFINDEEARLLSGEYNLKKSAQQILALGPDALVIKKGEHGCIAFTQNDEYFICPAYLLDTVIDPTGAGDSFAGGFMGYLAYKNAINPETIQQAVVVGTIIASFTCEAFGPQRLLSLTGNEIKQRCDQFLRQTQINTYPDFPF